MHTQNIYALKTENEYIAGVDRHAHAKPYHTVPYRVVITYVTINNKLPSWMYRTKLSTFVRNWQIMQMM